jgi:hypothetical protein
MANNSSGLPTLQETKAVAANFLVSVSLNVQKYAHNRNTLVLQS